MDIGRLQKQTTNKESKPDMHIYIYIFKLCILLHHRNIGFFIGKPKMEFTIDTVDETDMETAIFEKLNQLCTYRSSTSVKNYISRDIELREEHPIPFSSF